MPETIFDNNTLNHIQLARLDQILGRVYEDVCGSNKGYAGSRNGFVDEYGAANIMPFLNEMTSDIASSAPRRLADNYRSFLNNGQRCAEETPGRITYLNYVASLSSKKVDENHIKHLQSDVVHIDTPKGYVIIIGAALMTTAVGRIPTLAPIACKVQTAYELLPLLKSVLAYGIEVTRLNDYTVRILSGNEHVGDVSTAQIFDRQTKAIRSPGEYLEAWNVYLHRFLEKSAQFISQIKTFTPNQDDKQEDLKESTEAKNDLLGFYLGIHGFVNHPSLKGTWEHEFVDGQIQVIKNTMFPVVGLDQETVSEKDRGDWLRMSRQALALLFEPFDHLQKSFAIAPPVNRWVEVQVPERLPEGLWSGDTGNGILLRKVLDTIVYIAGQSAEQKGLQARLEVKWDEQSRTITITDKSVAMQALESLKSEDPPIDPFLKTWLGIEYHYDEKGRLASIDIPVMSSEAGKMLEPLKPPTNSAAAKAHLGSFDPTMDEIQAGLQNSSPYAWSHMTPGERNWAAAIIARRLRKRRIKPIQLSSSVYLGAISTAVTTRSIAARIFILPATMPK